MRALRHKKDEIDNAFMQMLRKLLTSKITSSGRPVAVVPTDLIKERLDDMQQIRDEYYSVESDYERLEVDLDGEEYDLDIFEDDLYHFQHSGTSGSSSAPSEDPEDIRNGPESDRRDGDDKASIYTLLGISGALQDDIHPLYEELLGAAGDRELAREHHEEIVTHRDKILYDLEREIHRERVRTNQGNVLSEAELKSLKSSLAHIPTDF